MTKKPEYRNVPIDSGSTVPARLMGVVDHYAMVRRAGAAPFVITRREWQEAPRCTPEGVAMKEHSS